MSRFSRRQFCATAVAVTLAPTGTLWAGAKSAAASSSTGLDSAFVRRFAHPPANARPKIRYWWPCGEIAAETIDAEIEAIAGRGFGAVEIQCIVTADAQQYGWGSAVLTERLEQAVAAGHRHGVRIDLTVGPAWPLVAPGLSPDSPEAAQEIAYGRAVLAGGEAYDGPVPAAPQPHAGVTEQTLIAVQAFRCAGPTDAKPVLLERDSRIDLTGRVSDGALAWTAPADGQWLLFAFWQRGTGQAAVVGQAATTEAAYVVDHFSAVGTRAVTSYWDDRVLTPRLRSLLQDNGGDLFEDSLELDSAQHWSRELPARFKKLRGYSLIDNLPVLFIDRIHRQYTSVTPDDTPDFVFTDDSGARVRDDYYHTLTDLYISEHVEPLKSWAHAMGLRLRAQPYGTTTDVPTIGAALDINETESLGAAPDYTDEPYRWLSSGAVHLSGQRVFSLEGCAIYGEAYAQTWPQMLKHFNAAFAHGVNQVVYHGFATEAGLGTTWPGFSPFTLQGGNGFSEAWGPRQPTWNDTGKIVDWTARTQFALRQGRPSVDLVVYRHAYGTGMRIPAGLDGFTYDFAGPAQLDGTRVRDRRLAPEGPAYRALILDRQPTLPIATARLLLSHARSGLPVVIVGAPPTRTPGAHRAAQQDAALAELMDLLLKQASVRHVAEPSGLPAVFEVLGIRPAADTRVAPAVLALRRTLSRGALYHLHNSSERAVSEEVALEGRGTPYELDAWTGTVTSVAQYRTERGRITVPVRLAPGESTIIVLVPGSARHVVATTGGEVVTAPGGGLLLRGSTAGSYTVKLDDGSERRVTVPPTGAAQELNVWELSVEDWHRGPDGKLEVSEHEHHLNRLAPWSAIPGLEDVSGVGTYRTAVRLVRLDGAYLDLGQVTDTFEVTVNGTTLPPSDQVGRRIDLSGYVKQGDNSITVRVATPLRNRLRVTEGFPGQAEKPRQQYGLMGPVRIAPYRQVPIPE
ncbi:glycosyl hydrolase [Streptomyces turgidiscabies]|uniref:glycosyl hydrolase n=1 Tax=Streptomyces turgidiscabies TaxID=85558 RepID=UPI0038F75505